MPNCPKCKSIQTMKNGKTYRRGGPVQSYRCKECGAVFNEG